MRNLIFALTLTACTAPNDDATVCGAPDPECDVCETETAQHGTVVTTVVTTPTGPWIEEQFGGPNGPRYVSYRDEFWACYANGRTASSWVNGDARCWHMDGEEYPCDGRPEELGAQVCEYGGGCGGPIVIDSGD